MARWALISGETGDENTAYAAKVVARLEAEGVRCGGFLQSKGFDAEGRKRHDLVHIGGGERTLLVVVPDDEHFCSMALPGTGFDAARRWIEEDASRAEVLVLDRIGKVEVNGRGHCAAVVEALRMESNVILLCASAYRLFYVVEKFGLREEDLVAALELPVGDDELDAFVRDIAASTPSARRLSS